MGERKLCVIVCLAFIPALAYACNTQEAPSTRQADAKVLFRTVEGDTSDIIQCQAKGIKECWKVELDVDLIRGLTKESEPVRFCDRDTFTVQLRSISGNAYSLRDPESSLDSTITFRTLEDGSLSIYGSGRSGKRTYAVEKCKGKDCNVMFYRDADYFNNFED